MDMVDVLYNFLNSLDQVSVSKEDWDLLKDSFTIHALKRGDKFVSQGRVCKRMGFIVQGVMRVYAWENDQETTYYFMKENLFAVDLESFYQQKPATKSIEAITSCHIIAISLAKLQQAYLKIPALERVVSQITQQILMAKLQHRSPLVTQDARTRYENFLAEQGDIALRVPLAYIASYLGITQQSLSRLRREIAQ